MTTDRTLISLADLVRMSAAIVDPDGVDAAVAEFTTRHEDADEPVRGILESLEERIRWGADEDPPVIIAQSLVLYLAHRLDEIGEDAEELLLRSARAEFDGHPPEPVVDWLADLGVDVR